jgi:hypothetical protein
MATRETSKRILWQMMGCDRLSSCQKQLKAEQSHEEQLSTALQMGLRPAAGT